MIRVFIKPTDSLKRLHCFGNIFLPQIAGYKTRSFLSDPEGVKRFVDLLCTKEKKMLLNELESHRELIVPVLDKDSPGIEERPTFTQLRQIAIHQALPFIGFGFLDNFIMILAGEYIELSIGASFGISTMAAAGLGNAVSDVAGIGSAWYVESVAHRIGVEYPKITATQNDMLSTKLSVQFGRVFGIVFGCLLGMCPLLFPRKDKEENSLAPDSAG